MEKKQCKRCNATKAVEEFNEVNRYCIKCLEKEREKYHNNNQKEIELWQIFYLRQ